MRYLAWPSPGALGELAAALLSVDNEAAATLKAGRVVRKYLKQTSKADESGHTAQAGCFCEVSWIVIIIGQCQSGSGNR
ncbi:hypothetical protein BOTNAR_0021g00050 [Botryotinia narcissicola]|uniref:Uncharacterized protein n=1 Tax=Botryotinia narcissicola TaxID=278944 RepID=A0A4Z1JI43_9HELO|nr:hypothetical protein BOTNAR_0021g00050 [Botryotinia narcissicola]